VDETSAHEVQASTGRAVAAHEPLWHPEQYAIEDQSNRIFVPGSGDRDVVWRDAHMRTRSHGLSPCFSRRYTRTETRTDGGPGPYVHSLRWFKCPCLARCPKRLVRRPGRS
jgi:hypothetical protein